MSAGHPGATTSHATTMLSAMSRKTGPAPRFDVSDAVTAAIKLGVDRFSMAQVASELGITPPALYRVVASREELLQRCMTHIVQHMHLPAPELPWQQQLRAIAEEMWRLCETYPGLSLAAISTPSVHEQVGPVLTNLVTVLRTGGCPLSPSHILFALDFIGDTVFMTHIGIVPMRERGTDGLTGLERVQREYRNAAIGGRQLFDAQGFVNDPTWTKRGFLNPKIDFIIAGLESGLAELPSHEQ